MIPEGSAKPWSPFDKRKNTNPQNSTLFIRGPEPHPMISRSKWLSHLCGDQFQPNDWDSERVLGGGSDSVQTNRTQFRVHFFLFRFGSGFATAPLAAYVHLKFGRYAARTAQHRPSGPALSALPPPTFLAAWSFASRITHLATRTSLFAFRISHLQPAPPTSAHASKEAVDRHNTD